MHNVLHLAFSIGAQVPGVVKQGLFGSVFLFNVVSQHTVIFLFLGTNPLFPAFEFGVLLLLLLFISFLLLVVYLCQHLQCTVRLTCNYDGAYLVMLLLSRIQHHLLPLLIINCLYSVYLLWFFLWFFSWCPWHCFTYIHIH